MFVFFPHGYVSRFSLPAITFPRLPQSFLLSLREAYTADLPDVALLLTSNGDIHDGDIYV